MITHGITAADQDQNQCVDILNALCSSEVKGFTLSATVSPHTLQSFYESHSLISIS